MSFVRLTSPLPVIVLLFSGLAVTGCVRSKPTEPEASSPTVVLSDVGVEAGELVTLEPGETYQVKFEMSNGEIIIEVYSDWAPLAAHRFKELVTTGFFNECRFFRVVPGFIVQWGINGDPKVQEKWRSQVLRDDKVKQNNSRGTITFATSGPNSRTTQLFINFKDNTASLNSQGFSPFGKVIHGMDIVDAINAEYGEKPNQGSIQSQGNQYLKKAFPKMDYIIKATLLDPADQVADGAKKKEQAPTVVSEPPKKPEIKVEKKAVKAETKKEEATKPAKPEVPAKPAPVGKKVVEKKEAKKKESVKSETIEEVK